MHRARGARLFYQQDERGGGRVACSGVGEQESGVSHKPRLLTPDSCSLTPGGSVLLPRQGRQVQRRGPVDPLRLRQELDLLRLQVDVVADPLEVQLERLAAD